MKIVSHKVHIIILCSYLDRPQQQQHREISSNSVFSSEPLFHWLSRPVVLSTSFSLTFRFHFPSSILLFAYFYTFMCLPRLFLYAEANFQNVFLSLNLKIDFSTSVNLRGSWIISSFAQALREKTSPDTNSPLTS